MEVSNNIFLPAIKNIDRIIDLLEENYPDAVSTSLKHVDPFQLLVATILSAQSTDKLVNTVTPGLFKKYSRPEDFASINPATLENEIRSTGFFRNKAKSIVGASREIVNTFGGKNSG